MGVYTPLILDAIPSPFTTVYADGEGDESSRYSYRPSTYHSTGSTYSAASASLTNTRPSGGDSFTLSRFLLEEDSLPYLLNRKNMGHTLPYYSIPQYSGGPKTGDNSSGPKKGFNHSALKKYNGNIDPLMYRNQ